MVTFGGAYAVLPYVSRQAVETHAWLGPGQMLDGLGLAETTPGPLIMVLQFVGFLGGWNHPGDLPPLLAATLGAGLTTWTTFLPCFLWIFLGAPHLEQLRGNVKLTTALSAVTAAVVGVILNLAVWFGRQVFFPARAGTGSRSCWRRLRFSDCGNGSGTWSGWFWAAACSACCGSGPAVSVINRKPILNR